MFPFNRCQVLCLLIHFLFSFNALFSFPIIRIVNLAKIWVLTEKIAHVEKGGYILFSRCPSERTNESVSVTFCFLNILKNH